MLREYASGCKTIQSRMFNEENYFRKMAEVLREHPGLTPLRLAEHMCVNEILVKEHIQNAEAQGYVCKDESHEGIRYYDNKIIQWA
jgi:ESCRT-II complex subunit VPS36